MKHGIKRWFSIGLIILIFILIVASPEWWVGLLHQLFPDENQALYTRSSLLTLVGEHLRLVVISSSFTIIVGLPLGIWVTRRSGLSFQPIVNNLVSIGQTFPPIAVLALAVPILGFGLEPTVFALFLYGMLPVVRNTIAGIQSVPVSALDAAYGIGMHSFQALYKVEIPLAARVIIAGIRISVIINIGTAMIGAVIGAGGLGAPVVAGLAQDNILYILQGVIPAAFLAIIVDRILSGIEESFEYKDERENDNSLLGSEQKMVG